MATIHDLTEQQQNALNMLEFAGDDEELRAVYENILAQTKGDIKHKLAWLSSILIEKKAHADVCKSRADDMNARAKTAKNGYENLKDFITQSMLNAGIDKIEGDLCTLSKRKGSESVFIPADFDARTLPTEFVKYTPEQFTPIKTEIKRAIKDGRFNVFETGIEVVRGADTVTVK